VSEAKKNKLARSGRSAASRLDDNIGDVMVVGAGISGIQASLDLANSGFKVFLIDRSPAIGGHMAQLDKVFPTNDCSMCIESPKLIECDRHPNIHILTCTEVDSVDGEAGDFRANLTRRPRYVREDRCRGCGACVQYCPVKVPDEYNESLSDTKAIRIHFPQAAPLIAYIDPETCLFARENKCGICAGVCKHKAIDLNQKERKIEVEVGAIILSPGYEAFDPGERAEYGYGKFQNVVTSLEFERILNSDGPYGGELLRPSDGMPPKKIAWVQCVGSRRATEGGAEYCSVVCCMYAVKQMILAKEHDSDIEATVFHNDIRACGKEFEQFYLRAQELAGAKFVRSYVSIGREVSKTQNVSIRFSADGSISEEEFDMVVLSVGLRPPRGINELAKKLDIELNAHGFCQTSDSTPLQTSRRGVFAGGAFLGPMDVPDSVVTGSGAAALCGQTLAERRGRLAKKKEYPPERDISGEQPGVGVFVCRCGANIGSVVDVPSVVQYSKSLDGVVHAEEMLFACSTDAAEQIVERIRDKHLNRVVVAACTPRTHEPLFQETLREAGINGYCFVMANIREHSSWVHSREKERATKKAKDKVRMSVARAVNLRPLTEIELPVNKRGLVVGGGMAGMTTALTLANLGFEISLVEKAAELGGMAKRIHRTIDGTDVQGYLNDLVQSVRRHPLIHILTNSDIVEVAGYVGNFTTTVVRDSKEREIKHGISIIAVGAEEHKSDEYLYGQSDRIMTLLELEAKIAQSDESIIKAKSMAIILCVGCREEARPHCSRICCGQAMKCALQAKSLNSSMDVYVLYRDMRTYGLTEDYYREAAGKGVTFVRYDVGDKPTIEAIRNNGQDGLSVSLIDPVLGKRLALETDIVALAAAVVPASDSEKVSRLFKAPLSRDGFFLEAHMKLRPVDFAAEGVFLCGSAHFPKTIGETIAQAHAAAGRAAAILSKDAIVSSGAVSEIDEGVCIGCGLCEKICQYGAIELYELPDGKKSRIMTVACQGCGVCNAVCPTGAVSQNHFTDSQMLAEIDCAVDSTISETAPKAAFEPRILSFLCHWCGYAGSDMAGVSRIQYAPTAREIRTMCSSRIHPKFIIEAFLQRADGVLVAGCHLGDCHYIKANEHTEKVIEKMNTVLEELGINPERLRHEYISAAEGAKYAEKIDDFTAVLTALGPLEISKEQEAGLSKLKLKMIGAQKDALPTY
jgi:heterodisulfide reductase subunit A